MTFRIRRWISRRIFPEAWEALVWMTGSNDFGPNGKAEVGFEKLVRPVLR